MKQNILLKISGASLKDENDILSQQKLSKLASDIVSASNLYNIGIVIGGGNIWRGNIASKIGMDQCAADNIGMLATIINSLSLKSTILSKGKNAVVYSPVSIPRMLKEHNADEFKRDLLKNNIVIFAGGTGMPFFTTDTAASLSASEIEAKLILMGKNNIDGLYDRDPNKYSDARFIDKITFEEVIQRKLNVADLTCMTMCMENNIDIIIFDIEKENSILNALSRKGKYSLVYNKNSNNYINENHSTNKFSYNSFENDESDFETEEDFDHDFNEIEIQYPRKEINQQQEKNSNNLYEYRSVSESDDKKEVDSLESYLNYQSVLLNQDIENNKNSQNDLENILKKVKNDFEKIKKI